MIQKERTKTAQGIQKERMGPGPRVRELTQVNERELKLTTVTLVETHELSLTISRAP